MPEEISSRYLSQSERIVIADMLTTGSPIRDIARRLGRAPSSISREIRANTNPDTDVYEPYRAHQLSHCRLKRLKTAKIHANPVLFALHPRVVCSDREILSKALESSINQWQTKNDVP